MALLNTVPTHRSLHWTKFVQIATANANRDGTGTIGTLVTGVIPVSEVDRVKIKAEGVTTAGMIRFFLNDGAGGIELLHEIDVTAVAAPGATTKTFEAEYSPTTPWAIPAGWILSVSTHNAETFDVWAFGGDY